MSEYRVAVVGGGLAGLEAARQLARQGYDVGLFEAEPSVGGRVRTEHRDGYTFDRGFQVLFTAYPEVRRALDLDALELERFPPGAVICRPNHRSVVSDPLRDPARAIETAFSRDISVGDKIRTLALRRRVTGSSRAEIFEGSDESISSYLSGKGFSQRFVDSFATPFYGGITLDRSLSTSKRVFEFTFKMLSEGHAAVPAEGMGAISRQLADSAAEAGVPIETESAVHSIEGTGPVALDLGGETIDADHVIVAAGPEASADLLDLDSIPRTGRGTVTQYLTLPKGNPVGRQPRIHLNAGGSVPNQVAVLSAVAPSYAPGDEILVSASTPGHLEESDDALARQTKLTLDSWYPAASFEDARVVATIRIPFAQYSQPPGIHETLPTVTAPEGDVYLAGDITEDSSINGALRSGRHAAAAVAANL